MTQCPKCGGSIVHINSSPSCEICGCLLYNDTSITESFSNITEIPWENIETYGTFKALLVTIRQCIFKPSKFFSHITEKSSLFHAWLFGLVAGSIGIIFNLLWQNKSTNLFDALPKYAVNIDFSNINAVTLIFSPLILSMHIFFLGLYVHFLLTITKGRHNNLSSTIITVCYAQSAAVLSIIPFLGDLVSPIWAICILIIGISRIHKISKIRSSITILLPFIFLAMLLTFVIIAAISGGILLSTLLKEILFSFR